MIGNPSFVVFSILFLSPKPIYLSPFLFDLFCFDSLTSFGRFLLSNQDVDVSGRMMEYVQLGSTLARRAVEVRGSENYELPPWAMGLVLGTTVAFIPLILCVSCPDSPRFQ